MGSSGSGGSHWNGDGSKDAFGSGSRSSTPGLPISRSHSPLPSPNSMISNNSSPSTPAVAWAPRPSNGSYVPGARKFLGKHLRKLSTSLPTYYSSISPTSAATPSTPHHSRGFFQRLKMTFFRRPRSSSFLLLLVALLMFVFTWLHNNSVSSRVRSVSGGSKFVIILAANQGGGVMTWKGAKEWAVERDSIANKRAYAKRWGYHLEIKDMSTKKRYAHEWRESWEKVDVIKQTMRQYPKAEWFWWLDLHTFIMEPSISLQSHIFRNLKDVTYRDINVYNPLNITHPPPKSEFPYLDEAALSAEGDGDSNSINLIIPQDCGGFNLGSFLIRRSEWSERLLDIWWDPVGYEQKHMEWEHKEQDALEYLYTNQPWIRTGTAFIPQRMINSFPPGACAETPEDKRIFYDSKDRDFVVNMAGCEWGRDCWGEMASYRKLSEQINKGWWKRAFG
ncbi:alpha-1,6-mannosyltransferase [Rhizina undulata]